MIHSAQRLPAVAGRFYPGDRETLADTIRELTPDAPQKKKAYALISPHAGYIYSGAVAAETIACVHVPETVIILGPNHHGQGAPVALSTSTWAMPMGSVPVDMDIAQALLQASPAIIIDDLAHRYEHSLEVQVPFLQAQQKNLSIVPLVISHISYPLCQEIGEALARVITESGKDILIVASSDMTHYEPRAAADKKDHYALKKLSNMNPAVLYRAILDYGISMCGIMPATIAQIAAMAMGATKTELVRYTDSGAVSGDTNQVVGYAGVLFL